MPHTLLEVLNPDAEVFDETVQACEVLDHDLDQLVQDGADLEVGLGELDQGVGHVTQVLRRHFVAMQEMRRERLTQGTT